MSLNKKLKKLIKDRPKYEIAEEAYQNQVTAKNAAYGRDNATVNAEQQMAKNTADSMAAAKGVSSSGAGIMALLNSTEASNNAEKVNLANQEAQAQEAGKADLAQANAAMAEEKDKAFDYNVNQPYQNAIQSLRDKKRARQELLMKGIDSATTMVNAATTAAGQSAQSGAGMMAMMCWVARAIYGEDNPQWIVFRTWLVLYAPSWFRELYTTYGERFADFINKYPFIKPIIKPFFDSRVNYMTRTLNELQRI